MKDINIKIEFFSPWHCGSGLSAGADADSLVIKDINGLPFIPGKTIKGLIREAVEDYAALRGLDMDLEKAFGKAATAEEALPSGTLFFTNATLKEDEAKSILSNMWKTCYILIRWQQPSMGKTESPRNIAFAPSKPRFHARSMALSSMWMMTWKAYWHLHLASSNIWEQAETEDWADVNSV